MIVPIYVPAAKLRPETLTYRWAPLSMAPARRLVSTIGALKQSEAALKAARILRPYKAAEGVQP